MKVVYNNVIPFKGYKAVNVFGIIFVRKGSTMGVTDFNHEAIHTAQMDDFVMGFPWLRIIGGIFFYVIYAIEFIIRLIQYLGWKEAYRNISFEREAFANENDAEYLDNRRQYAWADYINTDWEDEE